VVVHMQIRIRTESDHIIYSKYTCIGEGKSHEVKPATTQFLGSEPSDIARWYLNTQRDHCVYVCTYACMLV